MDTLKLYWLGPPRVELKGRTLQLETRKSTALLAYLSLTKDCCQREVVAALFWPEADQQRALGNLRRTLSSLNSRLPGWIQADRQTIALKTHEKLWVDVHAFRRLLLESQEHCHSENEACEGCLSRLTQAVSHYRGDFLEGLNLDDCPRFDEWQFFERDGLRQGLSTALQSLSTAHAAQKNWEQAIAFAQRWVGLDRLCEPASRTLMDLYARSGQKTAAVRQYDELVHLLAEQQGQEPAPETRRLYEQIRGKQETGRAPESPGRPLSFPLLKTKSYIPTTPAFRVIRARLIRSLNEAQAKPLTLISAPAGFGKTTLLAEWIAQSSLPVAWLSVDKGDNDPYRFLSYLIASLESIHDGIGAEAQQMMQSPQAVPPHIILASLINDLARVAKPYVLVLDDYHLITDREVHEITGYLLDHLPSNMHLVIATRADPPLQLGRHRAYGHMLELRTQDLRFTHAEATGFLNEVMHLELSAGDVEALQTRTEGWVVGLKMAALSLKGHENANEFIQAFAGSHRYVLDYLVEEVLRRQPPDIQGFLLRTSILEKLNGSLCDALMTAEWSQAGQNGQAVLEYLEASNLFVVPLDDHKQWYRYHHLFADLLKSRLGQFSRQEVLRLHGQASQWYEAHDLVLEAVQHAFAAEDMGVTIRLIERRGGDLVISGSYRTVLEWIRRLALERVKQQPWLCIWYAWAVLASGQFEGVEELIQAARRGLRADLQDDPESTASDQGELLHQILAVQISLASLQCQHSRTIEFALQALECTPDSIPVHRINILFPLGNAYYITGELAKAEQAYQEARNLSERTGFLLRRILTTHKLASIQLVRGNLRQCYDLYHDLTAQLERTGQQDSFGMGYIYSGLANLLYEWNHLDDAWQLLARSLQLNESTGVPMIQVDGYNSMVRILLARKDFSAAEGTLQRTAQLIEQYPVLPETKELFESFNVKCWLAKGDVQSAAAWSELRGCCQAGGSDFERELGDMALGRVLMAQGALDEASELLGRLAQAAEAGGRSGRLAEILLLQARLLQQQNQSEGALGALRKSLRLCESGHYVRMYVDEGPWLEELLGLLVQGPDADELSDSTYLHDLRDAFAQEGQESPVRLPV